MLLPGGDEKLMMCSIVSMRMWQRQTGESS